MKKRQNNSARASVLQITLAIVLMSISAILLASSFRGAPSAAVDQNQPAGQELAPETSPEETLAPAVIGTCDTAGPVEVEATAGILGPTAYPNLAGAIAAINAGMHQGVVNVEICASTTETGSMFLNGGAAAPANYTSVTIRPLVDGLTVAGPTTTGRGLIELNGASNVTIDGDNPNSAGTNRNLTIQNTAANTVTFTSVIRLALNTTTVTSANNVTIKNLNLFGSATGRNISAATQTGGTENNTYGILATANASGATTAPTAIAATTTAIGSPATASNLTIQNNGITTAARGIAVQGSATTVFPGLLIVSNVIGNATAGALDQVYSCGITAQGSADGIIRSNTVYMEGWLPTFSSPANNAINVGSISSAATIKIEKNMVGRCRNNNTNTWPAFGINLGGGNNHVVQNNFVIDVRNDQTAGLGAFNTFGGAGIRVGAGTGHKIYHNSVDLCGVLPGATSTDLIAAFEVANTTSTGMDVRNNIFSNIMTGGNPAQTNTRLVAIYLPSGGTSAMGLTLNNNDYREGTDVNNRMAQVGTNAGSGEYYAGNFNAGATVPATNFRAYTSTLSSAGTNDNATKVVDPQFLSCTDLHLSGFSPMIDMGVNVGVTDDKDGDPRPNCGIPDIGADEVIQSVCGATPTPTPFGQTPTPAPTLTPPPTVCLLPTEGFDDITTLVPAGWVMTNNSQPLGTSGWYQGNAGEFSSQAGDPGDYIAADFNNGAGAATLSNWLLTPPVTLENGAELSFWTRTVDTPAFADRLQVRMSTNGTSSNVGSTSTSVGDFTTLLLDINPAYTLVDYPNVWTNYVVVISGLGSPAKGRLAFRYFVEDGGPGGDNSDYIGIDTVHYSCSGGQPTPTPTPAPTPTPTPSPTPTPTPTPTPIACTTGTLFENFDGVPAPALPSGWSANNAVTTDGIVWVTSSAGVPAPAADSAPNAAFVNDPADINDKRLDSVPYVIANAGAQLAFRNNYALESGFDGGILEISIGGGAFTDIITAGGSFVSGEYNGTISTSFGSPIAGSSAWTGSSAGFITTIVNLPPAATGQTVVFQWRMGSDDSNSSDGWRIDGVQLFCTGGAPTPTPSPTPPPFVSVSGNVVQCSSPASSPVANVIMNLAGPAPAPSSTPTDASGNYTLANLAAGGTYTVTPTKAARAPGTSNINTVDVISVQKEFTTGGAFLPPGCRKQAADCAGPVGVNTIDVIAVQKFFLGNTTASIGNCGKYKFTPASTTYTAISGNQVAQNYSAIVFGDVAGPFVPLTRPGGPAPDAADQYSNLSSVAMVGLPTVAASQGNLIEAVTTSEIDAKDKLIGFQGDFTFDERVVSFASEPVSNAGLTGGNWNVSGAVLAGPGPMRTLRISAFSRDYTPLSGSGTLFNLNMTTVSKGVQSTPLIWAAPPDGFIFIDNDLQMQRPGSATPGGVAGTLKR